MKMNNQTIFVKFPTSTLVFQTIQMMPVYERSQSGSITIHYINDGYIKVYDDGQCERIYLDIKTGEPTGHRERWNTRPTMSHVMDEDASGVFYQFHTDGSVTGSYRNTNIYWGPEREMEFTSEITHSETVSEYVVDDEYCIGKYRSHNYDYISAYEDAHRGCGGCNETSCDECNPPRAGDQPYLGGRYGDYY